MATTIQGYKCVLLGDASVGKSSIVTRFVSNRFVEGQEATVGAAFSAQTVTTEDGNTVGIVEELLRNC